MSWARPRDQWKVNRAPLRRITGYEPTHLGIFLGEPIGAGWREVLECGHKGRVYKFRTPDEADGPPVDLRKTQRRCKECEVKQ